MHQPEYLVITASEGKLEGKGEAGVDKEPNNDKAPGTARLLGEDLSILQEYQVVCDCQYKKLSLFPLSCPHSLQIKSRTGEQNNPTAFPDPVC